ncbi:phosphatase PAP2 family protein [Enterococcus raffinosus]|nr:phosphatase PAP2 family protein [Enterococcus raffinosus]MBX9039318.1 phosphatase PAP2 family protein [Enterococcus raffinosus]MZZ67065.1 phosphatase PAP2 family protein [Enterococcus raffinosus]OFP10357.1 hypothetical protein HMPREF3001_01945 [Enterococcus sp. HMSC066C04]
MYVITELDKIVATVFGFQGKYKAVILASNLISFLGLELAIVYEIIICLKTIIFKKKYRLGLDLIILLSSIVIALVIKELVARPRPNVSQMMVKESGYSFPSIHTLVTTVVVTLNFYDKSKMNKIRNFFLILVGVISIILVALSRITLRVHYFSDTLASIFLGIFLVFQFKNFNKYISKNKTINN